MGVDFPFANLSSEDPDREVFLGESYGFAWLRPLLGSNWSRRHCLGVCTSLISQADADLCAVIQNLLCLIDTWGVCPPCDGNGNGFSGPPIIPRLSTAATAFYNGIQTCTVNCIDGRPFTYQVASAMFASTSQELADRIAFEYACKLAIERLICLSEIIGTACDDDFYSSDIVATAPVPVTFTITAGSLPPGISPTPIGGFTLALTGIPTTPGNYAFTVKATDSLGNFMQKTYTLSVFGITSTLPNATQGSAYSEQLTTTGGTGAVTFTIDSGSLPNGLTLSATGLVSGNPTEDGDFAIIVQIEDAAGTTCTHEVDLTVDPGSVPGAWYPFEELVFPPFVDTQNSIPMELVAGGAGSVTQTAGKVGARALLYIPNNLAGLSYTQNPSDTAMNVNGGFTMAGWVLVNLMGGTDRFEMRYRNYNGIWSDPGNPAEPVVLESAMTYFNALGRFEITLRNGAGVDLVTPIVFPVALVAATWYAFSVRYDQTGTGRLYFSLNNAAETASVDAFGVAIPNQAGRILLTCAHAGPFAFRNAWDEVNFWNHSLTPAELADIYNGGTGRTWP